MNEEHIQVFLNDEERDLHDLGDGIQMLIILMYPIFMADKDSWIFIEEPELNMHPGFQHLFLKAITTNPKITDKNLTFFITTHSNHLLNLSLSHPDQISIFTFEKSSGSESNKSISRIKKVFGNDLDVLNLLGTFNASVFMANCSIWVEGITDRMHLRAYLKAYIRDNKEDKFEYIEDLHYSFFEYGGSNIAHFSFLEDEKDKIKAHFLSNKIFLLAGPYPKRVYF